MDTNRVPRKNGNGRRVVLERKLRELIAGSQEREEIKIEYEADPLDQVTSGTEREIAVLKADLRAHEIRDVQAAIDKIADGTYGACEECDEPISARRLEILPWVRLCIQCQSRSESQLRAEPQVRFSQAA